MTARRSLRPNFRSATLLAAAAIAMSSAIAPAPAIAQSSTAESLSQAAKLYEDLQVERALVLLRQVISPGSPFEVSREQRVQAYVYLGASLAILGRRDSSVAYFRAALERDPFTDLDPSRFTEGERAAFGEARRRTLAVGARPLTARRIDPRTESIPLVIVATHNAAVRAEVVAAGDTNGVVVFDRQSDGLRELSWNARLANGRVAPPGRYWLVVRARDVAGMTDSSSVAFELAHDLPALEDSLPSLRGTDLLAERWPRSSAARQLAKGSMFAIGGLAISSLGSQRLTGGGRPLGAGIAIAGVATGMLAAFDRVKHPVNRAAVIANQRRRDAVAARNVEIATRNADRIAQLRIIVIPNRAPE